MVYLCRPCSVRAGIFFTLHKIFSLIIRNTFGRVLCRGSLDKNICHIKNLFRFTRNTFRRVPCRGSRGRSVRPWMPHYPSWHGATQGVLWFCTFVHFIYWEFSNHFIGMFRMNHLMLWRACISSNISKYPQILFPRVCTSSNVIYKGLHILSALLLTGLVHVLAVSAAICLARLSSLFGSF